MATEKGKLLKRFNEAFMAGDKEFVLQHVTDDIKWTMVGSEEVIGKEAFAEVFDTMINKSESELSIMNIITHGITAVVEGTFTMTNDTGEVKKYAFCDSYRFNKFKDGKIKEMRSYIIEVK